MSKANAPVSRSRQSEWPGRSEIGRRDEGGRLAERPGGHVGESIPLAGHPIIGFGGVRGQATRAADQGSHRRAGSVG